MCGRSVQRRGFVLRIGKKERPAEGFASVEFIGDGETKRHFARYIEILRLEEERLWVATDRMSFEIAINRQLSSSIGGAYIFDRRRNAHLILINLERIDRSKPRSVELVVVEELVHMRDWIDGNRRRHAKHGYDRIAYRVAELADASLDEIRSCLVPVRRLPSRYLYRCPGCQRTITRKRKGTWSCARCSSRFDPRFVFQLERDLRFEPMSAESDGPDPQERLPAQDPGSKG
jgi:predicted SprT family Zn-dependent metalloprotease